MHINEIPCELFLSIFSHLDLRLSYASVSLVCLKWHEMIKDPGLWEKFHHRFIGGPVLLHFPSDNVFFDNYKNIRHLFNTEASLCGNHILQAIKRGHFVLLRKLLNNSGLTPRRFITRHREPYNRTIIHQATSHGSFECVKTIFEYVKQNRILPGTLAMLCHGIDRNGENSIFEASKKGYSEILELLLTAVDAVAASRPIPGSKVTALHIAAENGHAENVGQLLEFGVSVNALDDNNETPLHYAARYGHLKCIEILLKHKANAAQVSKQNETAETLTRIAGYHLVADILKRWQEHIINDPTEEFLFQKADDWHLYFGGNYITLTKQYLHWMVESHKELVLPGIENETDNAPPQINLDSVYLSLRVDRAGSYEKLQAFQRLEQKVAELEAQVDRHFQPEERHAAVISQLIESPVASVPENPRGGDNNKVHKDNISLGQSFQSERGLVVLGDPGGGKTTLARWIALQLARALKLKKERVLVAASQVYINTLGTKRSETLVDIGITRLPILIRVADFAEYLESIPLCSRMNQDALVDYLGFHPWQGTFPSYNGVELCKKELHSLILDSLHRGRAVVIVDGLDEVSNPQQRREVVSHVDRFAWQWIYGFSSISFDSIKPRERLVMIGQSIQNLGRPIDTGGNQLIVTSRIAGYHSAPMQSPLTHVTIQPMESASVKSFCDSWMLAVHIIEDKGKSDDKEIRNRASAESKILHQIITEQDGVRKLAQNPLLLTILALVFRKQKKLPKLRAQLYRVAMEILVNVWRDCNMSLDDIIQSLAPLAAFLHANRPMGLISGDDLRERILQARRENMDVSDAQMIEDVTKFVNIVSEQVGFLVARGESMFGFLHQSFQEYLAGWFLIGGHSASYGIPKAASNFLERLGDARWREPLLLALGIISERWTIDQMEEFLHIIIESDADENSLVPRGSLLIMIAWKEMVKMPKLIAIRVQLLLLISFSKQNKYEKNSLELIRYRIESSFRELLVSEKEQVLLLFIKVFRAPKELLQIGLNKRTKKLQWKSVQDLCCACAELVNILGIFSDDLFFAIHHALQYDTAKWHWILHLCLRRFVSAKFPDEFSKVLRILPSRITLPFYKIVFHEMEVTNYLHKNVIASLCGGFQDFNVTASTAEYYNYVKFLHRDGTSRDDIGKMEISLYRWTSMEDIAYNIAIHLDTFIPKNYWSVPPKFSLEAIYNWPSLANIFKKRLCNDKNISMVFKYIYYSFPEIGAGKEFISSHEYDLLHAEDFNEIKTQALIALIAMGEDTGNLFDGDLARDCNLDQLDCVSSSVRDPAARARYELYQCLDMLSHCYDTWEFEQILLSSVIITTKAINLLDIGQMLRAQQGTSETVKLLDSLKGRSRGLVYGLYLLDRVSSFNSDDRVYRAALSADSMNQIEDIYDVTSALSLLQQLHGRIALLLDIPLVDPWPAVNPCAPVWDESEMLPIEALSALENIYFSWWTESILHRLHRHFIQNCPDVIVEILTVFLVCTDHETGSDMFGGLAPSTFGTNPVESLFLAATKISDHYYRSRALWRICRYFPSYNDFYLQNALESAELIKDVHRRIWITEQILSLSHDSVVRSKFPELVFLADMIPDMNNRARTFARLSLSPCSNNETLITRALETTLQIRNTSERAVLLNDIRLIIMRKKQNKKEMSQLLDVMKTLRSARDSAYAQGKYGSVLFDCIEDCAHMNQDSWIAISLFGLFEDAKISSRKEIEWKMNLWSSLLDEQFHIRAYQMLCDQAVAPDSNGLTLDASGIVALDTLMRDALVISEEPKNIISSCELFNRIYNLFYLVGEASSDILKYVMIWYRQNYSYYQKYKNSNSEHLQKVNLCIDKILQQIALLAVEHGILNVEIVHSILYLLQFGDDRSRIRVELALDGHYCCTANSYRRWRASELGVELLLQLAEANWNATEKHIMIQAETIGWMAHDLIHDDPSVVDYLIGLLEVARDDHDWYVASLWIRKSECFTESVWDVWMKYLTDGGTTLKIQEMMLGTVCKTAATVTNCPANWPKQAFQQLQDLPMNSILLDQLTVISDWPTSVANASIEALRVNTISSTERIQKANEIIEERKRKNSVRNALRSKDTLAEFGHSYYFLLRASYPGERSVPAAVEKLMNTPEILSLVILPWLQNSLESTKSFLSVGNHAEFRKQVALLEIAAGLAARLPVTYQNCATAHFASLISVCTRENESSFGRVAALELLTKYGHVSEETIKTMKCALLDNMFVSERALACAKEFRYLDDKFLEFLIDELYHPFPSISLAAAKILSGVYSEVATTSDQRERIQCALTKVVQDPVVKNKFIFAIINPGKKSSQSHATISKIYCLGTLEQSLFLALSSVCGFT